MITPRPFDLEHDRCGAPRRLHGEHWQVAGRTSGGSTCIALHGGPGYGAATLRAGAERLAEVADLLLVDLPGSGSASRHPGSGYPIEGYVADVLALCRRAGDRPPLLLGHGWGAILAVEAALAEPAAVAGVVMLNPLRLLGAAGQDHAAQSRCIARVDPTLPDRYADAVLPHLQRAMQGLEPWDEVPAETWWQQMWLTQWAGPPTPDWHAAVRGHRIGLEAYFAYKGRVLLDPDSPWNSYDLANRVPLLRCPASVLASRHEANYVALPQLHVEPLQAALSALDVELIDDAGHFLVSEAPAAVAAHLRRHAALHR